MLRLLSDRLCCSDCCDHGRHNKEQLNGAVALSSAVVQVLVKWAAHRPASDVEDVAKWGSCFIYKLGHTHTHEPAGWKLGPRKGCEALSKTQEL